MRVLGACSPVSMVFLCASEQSEMSSTMASTRDTRLTGGSALVHHQLPTTRPPEETHLPACV